MEKKIKALYKRLAEASIHAGPVYWPKPNELYVVIYHKGAAMRLRINVIHAPTT